MISLIDLPFLKLTKHSTTFFNIRLGKQNLRTLAEYLRKYWCRSAYHRRRGEQISAPVSIDSSE